jgi:hypothetical protein
MIFFLMPLLMEILAVSIAGGDVEAIREGEY